MKAVRLQEYGDVNQFTLEDVNELTPKDGEVVIEVAASGLNPVDLYIRQGYMTQYQRYRSRLECVAGDFGGGEAIELGETLIGPGEERAEAKQCQ